MALNDLSRPHRSSGDDQAFRFILGISEVLVMTAKHAEGTAPLGFEEQISKHSETRKYQMFKHGGL